MKKIGTQDIWADIAKGFFAFFVFVSIFGLATKTFAAAPTITTLPSDTTQTTITFHGLLTNGGSGITKVRFEWGNTPVMGNFTTYQNFQDPTPQNFSETLSGQTSGTTIYYRAEGINGDGPGFGSILHATLSSYQDPVIQTLPINNTNTDVTSTTALVQGWYKSPDSAAETSFQYANNAGLVGAYTTTPVSHTLTSNGVPFEQTLTGLQPNTTYYYRARVRNGAGTFTATTILSFRTTNSSGGNNCSISTFSASPSQIIIGNISTLSWSTANCISANISGIGSVGLNTSTTVNPSSTTTYTLTATGVNGLTVSQSVVVTVGQNQGYCTIQSFNLNAYSINNGGQVLVTWSTSGCTSVSVIGGGISSQTQSGSQYSSTLYANTTFTITASRNNDPTVSQSATVSVGSSYWPPYNYGTCSISNFYASPSQVTQGQMTTLYWNTNNCQSVNVSGGIPAINVSNYTTNGSLTINPTSTSTYYIYANGQNGGNQTQVTVTVIPTNNNYPISNQTQYACSDGVDNDGDGFIDLRDSGCSSTTDTSEYNYVATSTGGGNQIIYYTNGGATSSGSAYLNTTTGYGNYYGSSYRDSYRTSNNLAGLALFGSTVFPGSVIGWLILILIVLGIIAFARRNYGSKTYTDDHSNQY